MTCSVVEFIKATKAARQVYTCLKSGKGSKLQEWCRGKVEWKWTLKMEVSAFEFGSKGCCFLGESQKKQQKVFFLFLRFWGECH